MRCLCSSERGVISALPATLLSAGLVRCLCSSERGVSALPVLAGVVPVSVPVPGVLASALLLLAGVAVSLIWQVFVLQVM